MAYEISYVDNLDGTLAMCKMVDRVKTLALANGWTTLRDNSAADSREVILKGVGLSGLEDIYVGLKTYYNSSADYYNIQLGVFTGYVSGNSFETQPNAYLTGVPAHNNRIDYWLIVNAQRICCAMKVGTPVYESFYIGKMFPYGRPSQFPYPVVCGASFKTAAATRYSETTHNFMFRGSGNDRLGMRTNDSWVNPSIYPYNNDAICGATQLRDTNNKYQLNPVEIYTSNGIYGTFDGIYHITGFNNAVENTLVIGGVTYVVIQNIWRTSFNDYYAMRMQ